MDRRPAKASECRDRGALHPRHLADSASSLEGGAAAATGKGNVIIILVLLLLLVTCAFLPVLRNGFVNFDDDVYVYDNARVKLGLTWGNVGWALTTLDAGFWHPLTWLSFLVDRQLFGLRPAGYHFTALLLHAANSILLFLLFRRLTHFTWRSAFVAALFAVHPLHVESVAWVAERKDVLSTLFWLAAMLAYVTYAREKSLGMPGMRRSRVSSGVAYLLSLGFFICGLMSKTMIVTLPILLLLLDWWPLQRLRIKGGPSGLKSVGPLVLEKLPYLTAALVCGLLTIYAERQVGAVQAVSDIPFPYRLANAVLSCGGYLAQTLWPHGLTVFYPYPKSLALWLTVGVGLLLLVTSMLVLRLHGRQPYLAFGWAWYGITLLPVAGLIQVGSHAHADRYTYVPLIGIFVILVWGSCELADRGPRRGAWLAAAGCALLFMLVLLTRNQVGNWKDSRALFRHALAATENNHFAHNNLGLALLEEGRADEAIGHFRRALEIEPGYGKPHNNLGIALLEKGRNDEALTEFQAALADRADLAEVSYNLGVALLRKGQPQQAVARFQKALENRPDFVKARYGLGSALLRTGQTPEAEAQFRQALALDPAYAEAHNDLGLALLRENRVEQAIAEFRQALSDRPDAAETCYNLGLALVRKGQNQEAIGYLQKAVEVQPGLTEAQVEWARALLRTGNLAAAAVHFQEALRRDPKAADVQSDFASVLLRQGRAAEALAHYQAAADAEPRNPFLLNNLAWVLATCPDASVRDGPKAVELARQASRLSGDTNPSILETLAAAYAETGNYSNALATAERALELVAGTTNSAEAKVVRTQIGQYRSGSPLRDPLQPDPALNPGNPAPAKK